MLVLAACVTGDVEGSAEFDDLRDERDELAAELSELEIELDEVKAELAVADAKRTEAEVQLSTGGDATADLTDLLVLDVMNRVGLSRSDAECVAQSFLDDDDVRRSYLLLIDPSSTDAVAAEAAFGEVSAVLAGCGLEVAQPADTTPPAEVEAALAAVLGEVEVVGEPLPQFVDGAADPAVGTTAPVVVGADYDGNDVRIDAVADGPTMVVVVAHWCPFCNDELPKINQLLDEGRIPDGVNVVLVSSGLAPDRANFPPDAWLESAGWTLPVVADGPGDTASFAASSAYGTAGVPFVTLIDGEGTVTGRWAGARDIEQLAAALETLAG
jgi:cytochrome c biogenesis protein CcmG, thiol:disulfide interchange protein DsbE